MFILRIAFLIVLFLSVIFLPWFVTLGLAIIATTLFLWFWEIIIIGILLGALYSFSKDSKFLFTFFIFGPAMILFFEEYLKQIIQGKNIISYAIIAFSGGVLLIALWIIFKIAIYV